MIVDCFNFYNEIEILHMRLDYLYDVVDKFVIVESLDSHSKKVRKDEYVFEKNIDIYKSYMDKIVYLKIDNLPFDSSEPWKNENYQKNYCVNGLGDMNNNDWIMFSDVDEIPNKEHVKNLKYYDGVKGLRFSQKLFYYNVNVLQNQIWGGTVAIQKQFFSSMMDMRKNRDNFDLLTFNNGGWHYSYMGGYERVYNKMQSYAESNDNGKFSSMDNIKKSIDEGKDLLNRVEDMFVKKIVDIKRDGMAPSNINKMIELYPYLLKKDDTIKISYVCLIYKSVKWLQFVYDQVMKHTNLEGNEFFFIANDAHPSVLKYLVDKNMPHYVFNNTEEHRKEWYINNVYRACNYGGLMAKGEYIVFMNSDMAFSPGWADKLMDKMTDNICITSRLVERGILRSGTYGIEKNFGDGHYNYREDDFLKYTKEIGVDILKDGGLYMPLLIKKDDFFKVGCYPEGNIIVGSDMFNPVYAKLGQHNLIPGDITLMAKLKSVGIHHKTHFDSIVYHFQQGEMLEEIKSNNDGWLVNDTLTCIPGTKTFWHFLLSNIDGLVDKTGGHTSFDYLATNIENMIKKDGNPKYIIRNATYFRRINTDAYTISVLQDNQSHHEGLFSMQKDVLKHSNLVIVNSVHMYNTYKNYITGPYKILPLGVNFELFKPSNDKCCDVLENSIIYVGSSLVYPKGFDRVLKIMSEMKDQNFCLVLKDNYSHNELPEDCKNRVKIFNCVDENKIVSLINSCVMGICTSYEETQHLAGIEICACNKPMASTNVGWYSDMSNNNQWGIICNDINFVDNIKYMMGNLNKFGSRQCLLDAGYDNGACKNRWLDIIKNI